ncbi:hypothetical protein CAPTEDRAFT_223880 [Capitella teleta]|uniref:Uncharacterized protein n=1 Tax=Capitella teleta TaxID=283909 RepID=R7UC33_CAPTE|nr:hypothetical protein CAPTEDRAFT_223880 [Capitella teleta]|eukprot:ELU03544.1 hypothetical protein CAPTEDRAFT_223880 [Capitella teleta]
MNGLLVFVFLGIVASALASGYGYQPGFKHVPNGVATPYRNDLRQVAVNHVAEYVGSGTGTARFYGVPGANSGVYYNYPAYGHGAGYGGHNAGYGGHNAGYGGYGAGYPNAAGYGYGPSHGYQAPKNYH